MSKGRGTVFIAVAALAALLLGVLAAGPAVAGKGNGNGNGNGHQSSAVLWTDPSNPYPAHGFDFEVMGSGFNPDSVVHVSFGRDGSCCLAFNVMSDSEGDISFGWTTGEPGMYRFAAYQDLKGNHWDVHAEIYVEVAEQ